MAYGPIAIHVPNARATPYGDRSTGFNSSGLPLRPGAEKCAFFLKTGNCKFGAACWKDHPENVTSSGGGICKLNSKGLPLRPGQEQCAFYMRTGTCKFGHTCKNDHPEDEGQLRGDAEPSKAASDSLNELGYPFNEGELECAYYMKTGQCKFGATCKFSHPNLGVYANASQPRNNNLNDVGFPLNPGEPECAFYMKTGQCKFGVTCKYSHPNRSESSTLSDAELVAQLLEDTGGEQSDVAMELQSNAGGEADSMTGSGVTLNSLGYPVRPGEEICAYYLKTGTCQFGASCWKDHPEGAGSTGAVVCELNSKGLPIRPGQEHCSFYLKTGTCKFGRTCKNDHPENVQELGTDENVSTTADNGLNELGYPINPGEPECSYYMKTGQCKFGATCKFSHPSLDTSVQDALNELGYPLNPGEPECAFYMKTGQCKFGTTCKFSHPTLTSAGVTENDESTPCIESLAPTEEDETMISADGLNELGYPLNHGEIECAFYMKTGHCKFGATCKFAHPSLTISSSNEVEGASAASCEVVSHLLALAGSDDYAASSPGTVLMNSAGYPLRPGAEQCTYYLKTGTCKFGAACRHDHPEGVASSGGLTYSLNSKGLPLRPGEEQCAFYMRTGTCKFGHTCKHDHPEEVAGLSGDGEVPMTADDGLNELGYPLNPGEPECAYYIKTGQCKFGATCKFSHPTLVSASSTQSRPEVTSDAPLVTQLLRCATEEETHFESSAQECTTGDSEAGPTTAVDLNSLGYPVRPGVEQCAFYLKTGTCQFGATCWKDHPEISPDGGGVKQELNSKGFPLRPGQEKCAFYMRTGTCKFGWTCKNDHPEETTGDGEATITEDLDLNELGYPLNPGEPECAFYMKTGQCKFGVTCKFSHPSLATSDDVLLAAQDDASLLDQMVTDADSDRAVEEEEVMQVDPYEFAQEEAEVGSCAEIILNSLGYPLRPGAEQCAFYLKTGTCKFGATCRNDHPEGVSTAGSVTCELNSRGLPLRPGQEQCAFYMKTGTCKFGRTCKNDHPEEVEVSGGEGVSTPEDQGLNDLGYPFNPGELECAFYMKTGQCKFGASCKFSHPTLGAYVIGSRAAVDGLSELGYPWNHGEPECAFYMKTGQCKFGATCKFSHPILTSQSAREIESAAAISEKVVAQILAMNSQEDVASAASGVALNSLGYPIRRGAEKCSFFLKTGTCKFGATCKNDHPELAVSTCELNSVGLPLRPDAERCAFYMRTGTCKFGATCKHDHPEL